MTSNKESLFVTSISIKNAYGIRDAKIDLGKVTVLSGANGEGKTSFLKSIESVFSGGRDAALLNTDSDSGEIILALNNDSHDNEIKVCKKFTKNSHSLSVDRNGEKVPSPQTFLKELTSSLGCNPLVLLNAKNGQRTQYFLDALPVNVDMDELSSIMKKDIDDSELHGIVLIDSLYQELYMDRRDINRSIDRLNKTIASAQVIVDDFDPENVVELTGELNDSKVEREALISEQGDAVDLIGEKFAEKAKKLESKLAVAENNSKHLASQYDNEIKDVEHALEMAISKLKEKARADKDSINERRVKALSDDQKVIDNSPGLIEVLRRDCRTAIDSCKSEHKHEIDALDNKISSLEKEIKEANKAEPILEHIGTQKKDLAAHKDEADGINKIMDDITAYKKKLLQEINIDWFDYRDKKVYIDGVEFDGVNTARLIQVAIDVARLQSPSLRLLCLDGIESLDNPHFELLVSEVIKSNMNVIVTKVSDEDRVRVESMFGDDASNLEKRVAYAS